MRILQARFVQADWDELDEKFLEDITFAQGGRAGAVGDQRGARRRR